MFTKSQSTLAWKHVNAILDSLDALEELTDEVFEEANVNDTDLPKAFDLFANAINDGHDHRAYLAHLLVKHGTPQ